VAELRRFLEQRFVVQLVEDLADGLGVKVKLGGEHVRVRVTVTRPPHLGRGRAQAVGSIRGLVVNEQLVADLLDDKLLRSGKRQRVAR
jgi:hypothetical protein